MQTLPTLGTSDERMHNVGMTSKAKFWGFRPNSWCKHYLHEQKNYFILFPKIIQPSIQKLPKIRMYFLLTKQNLTKNYGVCLV